MLTAVDITNSRGDTLHLSLMDYSIGYLVKDIEGLGPVNAALTSSSMAQVDGAQFQSARRDIRNITMKLGLKPDYSVDSVQSLRANLYAYLLPKANVKLGFYLDDILYAITSGQVETFDNPLFVQEPEADISILCYDPDLYGSAVNLSTHTQADSVTTTLIQYAGTSDAGFIFTLSINRSVSDIRITNTTPDGVQRTLEIVGSFVSGDILTINTIPGSKKITRTRAGLVTSVLYYKTSVSTWPFFQNGDNLFGAFCSGAGIPFVLNYTPKFGGL